MTGWWLLLLVFVVFGGVMWRARAHNTLFSADFANGKVRVRGRVPLDLLGDLEDIARRTKANGKVVATAYGSEVELDISVAEPAAQRVRNAVMRFPLARLRAQKRR